jgi:hypothetical protein
MGSGEEIRSYRSVGPLRGETKFGEPVFADYMPEMHPSSD